MSSPSNSRQLFLRYILDELSPDERAGIDDALITDQQFSDSFQQARYDLIDAYTANELTADVRKRVEQAIFSIKHGTSLLPAPPKHYAVAQIRRRKFRIAFFASALAACILLAVVFVHVRQRAIPQMAQTPHATPLMTASRPKMGKSNSVQPSTPTANPSPRMHPFQRQTSVMAIAMPIGTARGASAIPIRLLPGVDRIEVQWPIPSDSAAPPYTLEIASDQSSLAGIPQHGRLATVGNIRVANFLIGVDKLPNSEYIFRLRAADASGTTPIAESSVRISR